MATIASVSEGDANRIPEDLKERYFHPDFKEYMLEEQLKWSRVKVDYHRNWDFNWDFNWVFWSQQDHGIEPSLSVEHRADFNPNLCAKVRDNIRHALQKIISASKFPMCLVQFWAPLRTSEGRTVLKTQYQPFALGCNTSVLLRDLLCEYRMKMCRDYNFFYADAESGEEQLGLPGRVFLSKSLEYTHNVKLYSEKDYPQRNLALVCNIVESWALPVVERSSQTCVGVLEIVSLSKSDSVWRDKSFKRGFYTSVWLEESFHRNMYHIFQELGLQYFDGYHACIEESRKNGKRVKGLPQAFKELKTVLRSVCEIHELPLAMTWVPCTSCESLRRGKVGSVGVEFCLHGDISLDEFIKVGKCNHLRKGLVAERAHSSPDILYCSDITQLSLDEYPLVLYARLCKLSGWFTIALQCEHTKDYIYVLEFFLSARSKDDENILTTLSFILGTIEEKFKFTTFRLASGQCLGELTSVEVIHFKNNQRFQSEERIQATRDFSISSIPSSVQSSASVANTRPGFQDANMGTINAEYDLNCNPFSNFDLPFDYDSDPSFEQPSTSVGNTRPGFQNANMVIIIAEYASNEEVFQLSLPCRLVELEQEVTKRLMLEAGNYSVTYEDEEDETVLIACDEDLQTCVDESMLQGNTPRVVLLEQSSTSVANTRPGFQNANMVIIIAKYASNEEVFQLSLPCRLVELQQEVTKRLMLEAGNYSVTYEDEEDEPVLIACDEDLQTCVDESMLQGNTPRVVLLEQ